MDEIPSDNPTKDPFERAVALEREAGRLYREKKSEEAFDAFDKAGEAFSECGEHLKAAVCFASAATCWNILTGWQPLNKAATRSYRAAQEAMKGKNYEYARALYHDAALLYEKEGDSENYSRCFIESKQADAQKHWMLFLGVGMFGGIASHDVSLKDRFHGFRRWLMHLVDYAVWGYGEQPFRTLLIGFSLIGMNAFIFSLSGMTTTPTGPRPIDFWEALYMSVITFTTVGYGDYLPLGWTRAFAALEAFSGVVLTPLFIVSLTRRYLRIDR